MTSRTDYPKCATCSFHPMGCDTIPRVKGRSSSDFGCLHHSSLDPAQAEAPAADAANFFLPCSYCYAPAREKCSSNFRPHVRTSPSAPAIPGSSARVNVAANNPTTLGDVWTGETRGVAGLYAHGFTPDWAAVAQEASALPSLPSSTPVEILVGSKWLGGGKMVCVEHFAQGHVTYRGVVMGDRLMQCERYFRECHRWFSNPASPPVEPSKRKLRVVVESPFGRNVDGSKCNPEQYARNTRYLNRCLLDSLSRGEAPYASHRFFPGLLDDTNPEHREQGMAAVLAWGEAAELIAFYTDHGETAGITRGLAQHEANGIRVERRSIGAEPELPPVELEPQKQPSHVAAQGEQNGPTKRSDSDIRDRRGREESGLHGTAQQGTVHAVPGHEPEATARADCSGKACSEATEVAPPSQPAASGGEPYLPDPNERVRVIAVAGPGLNSSTACLKVGDEGAVLSCLPGDGPTLGWVRIKLGHGERTWCRVSPVTPDKGRADDAAQQDSSGSQETGSRELARGAGMPPAAATSGGPDETIAELTLQRDEARAVIDRALFEFGGDSPATASLPQSVRALRSQLTQAQSDLATATAQLKTDRELFEARDVAETQLRTERDELARKLEEAQRATTQLHCDIANAWHRHLDHDNGYDLDDFQIEVKDIVDRSPHAPSEAPPVPPQPLPRKVEPGSTLEVGATYRIVEIGPFNRCLGNALGDLLTAISDNGAEPLPRPYVSTSPRVEHGVPCDTWLREAES